MTSGSGGGNGSGSGSSAPAKTPYQPNKPTIGGLVKTHELEYSAWTDGKPNQDWTGLEDTSVSYKNPLQIRNNSIGNEQKAYLKRSEGLANMSHFKQGHDFQEF